MSLKVVKFDTKMNLNFSNFRGRTSAGGGGGGQALVQKWEQVLDGGLTTFLPDGGPPVPPRKKTLYAKLTANPCCNGLKIGSASPKPHYPETEFQQYFEHQGIVLIHQAPNKNLPTLPKFTWASLKCTFFRFGGLSVNFISYQIWGS